jgi:hypothetical protein
MVHRNKYAEWHAIKENNVFVTASETDEQTRMEYFARLYSAETQEERGKLKSAR